MIVFQRHKGRFARCIGGFQSLARLVNPFRVGKRHDQGAVGCIQSFICVLLVPDCRGQFLVRSRRAFAL